MFRFHEPTAVTAHPWCALAGGKYLTTLRDISLRDYPRDSYFAGTQIPALDPDTYETDQSGNNESTADAAIGIATHNGRAFSNHRLLLVELRMDYKSADTLSTSSLLSKEDHTRHILTQADPATRIDPTFCLVFTDKVVNLAVSFLARRMLERSIRRDWRCFTHTGLCEYINYGKQLPFEPATDTKRAAAEFAAASKTGDVDKLEKAWTDVRNHITCCQARYWLEDVTWLKEQIRAVIEAPGFKDQFPDDDQDYLEILLEEIR